MMAGMMMVGPLMDMMRGSKAGGDIIVVAALLICLLGFDRASICFAINSSRLDNLCVPVVCVLGEICLMFDLVYA